ncbi:Glycosyl transferase [Trichostrongylus colubriformis]|uniref:Alpha-1,3/1,6-mannosyltransferase ALG2 n=1 Tax=Trichostrongylus colubriformis TaxID=6319 RepID=A0AAN8F151_TRICO
MHVVIIHPEQWNGGSDRCTVALIRHFVSKGYKVTWLTTMIDEYWKDHKFDGVDIHEVGLKLHPGDWWSQNVALGWYLIFNNIKPDLVVIDHSARFGVTLNTCNGIGLLCVPLIKWRFPSCKVLFYCHFPQQLVTPSRFFLYRWYSNLIGVIEEHLFEHTDVIMVNSHFTASQFSRVMPRIEKSKIRVVYPPCDVDSIAISAEKPTSRRDRPQNDVYVFMSMNRFWPEKRLDIIIEAASLLKKRGYKFLVQLAGSVMPHIPESRIYYELLQKMTRDLDVEDVVQFIPSPSEFQKFELYRKCDSALYTPPNEHFGIVPIEALDQRRPVIVCDSGGPAETVIEDVTGSKILKPTGELLAEAMMHHIKKQDWPALDCDETYEKQVKLTVTKYRTPQLNFRSSTFATEHAITDELYPMFRIERVRFDRDFSLRGFCAHIDEAVSQLFPNLAAISSRNRRALA